MASSNRLFSARSRALPILLAAVAVALVSSTTHAEVDSQNAALSRRMSGFVATLDKSQQKEALYDFDDDERWDLRLAPLGLEGLRISQMSSAQWRELESLLGHVLSPTGLSKLNTIRSLEREVAETEGGIFGFFFDHLRDAKRYFLTVYGSPGTESPWAMRFDGHHLSVNTTAVPDAPLSGTPLFLGGQPRVVPAHLERAGLRVLEGEEEAAIAFLNGLTEAERQRANRPLEEGSAIRRPMSIGGDVELELEEPQGVARSALGAESQKRFDDLMDVHLENFEATLAHRYRTLLFSEPEGPSLLFAAASENPSAGQPLYYRIQGGGFMIEFDNTSDAADHIHVVMRHPRDDFGRDALAEHLSSHHAEP